MQLSRLCACFLVIGVATAAPVNATSSVEYEAIADANEAHFKLIIIMGVVAFTFLALRIIYFWRLEDKKDTTDEFTKETDIPTILFTLR